MTENDVIAKLSRILETHSFGADLTSEGSNFDDSELGQFIAKATSATPSRNVNLFSTGSTSKTKELSPPRTPFDAWQQKVASKGPISSTATTEKKSKSMTENQKETLVETLFRSKKAKERYFKSQFTLLNRIDNSTGNLMSPLPLPQCYYQRPEYRAEVATHRS